MKENKIKLEDLQKKLYLGEIGEYLCDYNNGYICDVISEIGDSNIDIYYYDLFEWAKNNFSIIEEANEEFGCDNDITKQIQQGQYLYYTNDLYDNLEDIIKNYIYNYIINDLKIEYITKEQFEELEDLSYDNNDKLEDVINDINDIFKK